ncbi:MAG: UvrD-helicase domain-containing protein [Bacteroidales bacterium]|nr:UvrD-helicase domain-containing protein [Bacteroidales bacterium]
MGESTEKLWIYSASAGAGKTYTIAYEFISMILLGGNYRDILAVTFTNKASEEMKSRIVSDLFQISNVDAGIFDEKVKKETEDIIDHVAKRTKLTRQEIINRSKKFFAKILHDYSFFSVSTIDSFFQKIVRTLTYELGIQQNFELELNTKLVISQLVDDIMLRSETDKNLNACVSQLIESNIDDDKGWSPRQLMFDFILKAIEADYRACPSGFDIEAYKKKQKDIVEVFCCNYKKCVDDILAVLEKDGKHGVSPFNWLQKLKKGNLGPNGIYAECKKAQFSEKKWFNKGADQANIDKVDAIISNFESANKFDDFCTALVLYNSIDLVKMLDIAMVMLRDNLERDALFLLSEVPSVLSSIIEKFRDSSGNVSVMPFIFEKVGTNFNHFMIDEFQDTSDKQWNIFRTMLEDSLSHEENSSIIVGDIKQSIYSWRGGDWRILNNLKEKKELREYSQVEPLEYNFRTAEGIVIFNNDFFSKEYSNNSSFFGVGNEKLYSDVEQGVKKKVASEIKVNLYEGSMKKAAAKAFIFSEMLEDIERLQSEFGVKPSQITILVRKKPEASLIAKSFCEIPADKRKKNVCYDVVSNEALFLNSNRAVRLIIAYMRSILNPSDNISLVEAAYLYHLETINANGSNYDGNISKSINELMSAGNVNVADAQVYKVVDTLVGNLNKAVDVNCISGKQAFEVMDILVDKLKLNEKEENIPFLIAFRNVLHNFSLKSTDLQAFVEYWDERGVEETITIPENQDAIKILTVHKSKGLEADYIFIPFCDWDFVSGDSRKVDYLYVRPKDNPDMKIPVANKSILTNTDFKDDYKTNIDRVRIESFNLLYVAFTRAKYGLYVSAYQTVASDKEDGSQSILKKEPKDVSYMLWEYFSNPELDGWDLLETEKDGYKLRKYVKGGLSAKKNIETNADTNDSILRHYPICENPESGVGVVHHLSDAVQGEWTARVKGTKYHSIFENIVTLKDVQPSVMQMYYSGEIDGDMAQELIGEISSSLNNPYIKPWFEEGCKVYNEFNIIDPDSKDEKLKRPDRVMVFDNEVVILDYKFGEEKHDKKYAEQVLYYADLISKMDGFEGKKISKYVWYYFRNELAEIKGIDDIAIKNLAE